MTAVALVPLGLWFLFSVLNLDIATFDAVSAWIGRPVNVSLMALTFATIAYHSKLGVQVVIEDYVHGPAIRSLSLRLNVVAHLLVAVAGLYALAGTGLAA